MYYNYFNDVYTAEIQLYYVLAKAVDSLRQQSEMLASEQECIDIGALVEEVAKGCFEKVANPRIAHTIFIHSRQEYIGYRKSLQRLIENIAALFLEAKNFDCFYQCRFEVQEGEGKGIILASMSERNVKAVTCNDNYLALSLHDLIDKLKNNEEISVIKENSSINLMDANIRSRLYSLQFLSHFNPIEVELRFAQDSIVVAVMLMAAEAVPVLEV